MPNKSKKPIRKIPDFSGTHYGDHEPVGFSSICKLEFGNDTPAVSALSAVKQ
jgi:hypothetical protein